VKTVVNVSFNKKVGNYLSKKRTVFWDVAILMMEAVGTSEMSVNF
jgi:hypothetical protein